MEEGSILILNASPRAPKSNTKRFAAAFARHCSWPVDSHAVTKTNHRALCEIAGRYTDILLAFPLYADAIPSTLLAFLKTWEEHPSISRPRVSVLVNCGFLEYRQNDVAVRMVQLFCRQNGYPFGSVLEIGSGEAIWDTPFRVLVHWKLRQLAKHIISGRHANLHITMPLPAELFLRASTTYWTAYGRRHGVSAAQMDTMQIESSAPGQTEQ